MAASKVSYLRKNGCRVLLISDFSEECDDEAAFELLMAACQKLLRYNWIIELLVPDTLARIQWFEYIFSHHFDPKGSERDNLWLWQSPNQFRVGLNIVVNLYCTPSPRGPEVTKKIDKAALAAFKQREKIPNHLSIDQNNPIHYILWNAPIPTTIESEWFAKFYNEMTPRREERPPFHDGVLKTFQIGGPGSVNSRPADHFQKIVRVLSREYNELTVDKVVWSRSVVMFEPAFTRDVAITRGMATRLPSRVQHTIFANFVRFAAQRPEIKGKPLLVLRINRGNAGLCNKWLLDLRNSGKRLSLTHQDKRDAKAYATKYVERCIDSTPKSITLPDNFRTDLEIAVVTCLHCSMTLFGRFDKKISSGPRREKVYADPLNNLAKLQSPKRCIDIAQTKLTMIQSLTPAYDSVSVLAMLKDVESVRSRKIVQKYLLAAKSEARQCWVRNAGRKPQDLMGPQSGCNLPETLADNRGKALSSAKTSPIPIAPSLAGFSSQSSIIEPGVTKIVHYCRRMLKETLGLHQVRPAMLDQSYLSNAHKAYTVGAQTRGVVEAYSARLSSCFSRSQTCRILLASDFSEECDDEVAFELLMGACSKLTKYKFVIEVLIPDAVERLQWFRQVFDVHFDSQSSASSRWTWSDATAESPTPLSFIAGDHKNVEVRFYLAESDKKAEVAQKMKPTTRAIKLPAKPACYTCIPQDIPLHYFLWNAPVPTTIAPGWFSGFYNTVPTAQAEDVTRAPFNDGVLRVIQIGGPGSINSKPDAHFKAILHALEVDKPSSSTKEETSVPPLPAKKTATIMFTAAVTRKVRITRSLAERLPKHVRDQVYSNFVKFMAQRPEFPGPPSLMLRINSGNADMCRGWNATMGNATAEGSTAERTQALVKWAQAYTARHTKEDTPEADVSALRAAVYECVLIASRLLSGDGTESLYKNPMKNLAELKNQDECIRIARENLMQIQELTPAYDAVAVVAMFRHLEHQLFHGHDDLSWPGLGVINTHPYTFEDPNKPGTLLLKRTCTVPGQPWELVRGFTSNIDEIIGIGGSASPKSLLIPKMPELIVLPSMPSNNMVPSVPNRSDTNIEYQKEVEDSRALISGEDAELMEELSRKLVGEEELLSRMKKLITKKNSTILSKNNEISELKRRENNKQRQDPSLPSPPRPERVVPR